MATEKTEKKSTTEESNEKKWTKRSDEELLTEALARVETLKTRIAKNKMTAEERELLRKARSPLINFVNRMKTFEEIEDVIKLLTENGYQVDISNDAKEALEKMKNSVKEYAKEETKETAKEIAKEESNKDTKEDKKEDKKEN